MIDCHGTNADQIAYWNDAAGATWAKLQRLLDRQIDPLGREAIRRLAPRPGERILDVGCGCGQTTLEIAEIVGPEGAALGVDVSKPMLAVARARPLPSEALNVEFREGDAQVEAFAAGAYDAAFSRFGVMFFSDPAAAFANLRRALVRRGRLVFVCWRELAANDWMRVPLEAARHLLPPSAPPDPAAPGPFAFADPTRVRGILDRAGFDRLTIEIHDDLIGESDLESAVALACRIGPLGAALREHRELLPTVADAVRAALLPYRTTEGVRLPAAVWIVTASNPG